MSDIAAVSLVQNLRFTVSLYEEDTVITDHENEDAQFLISEEQLMKFFRSDITFRPEKGMLWQKDNGISSTFLFNFPKVGERKILLNFNNKTEVINFTFPSLLIQPTVSNGRITDMNVWAYAGCLKESSVLYELPLPNFAGSGLCLGGTQTHIEGTIRESVERVLLDTPFNSHRFYCGKENLSFTDFLKKYQGKMPFHRLNKLGTARKIL